MTQIKKMPMLQSLGGQEQVGGEYPVRPTDPQKVTLVSEGEGEERQYMVMTISGVDLARMGSVHTVCCLWTERGVRIVRRVYRMPEFMKVEGVEGIKNGWIKKGLGERTSASAGVKDGASAIAREKEGGNGGAGEKEGGSGGKEGRGRQGRKRGRKENSGIGAVVEEGGSGGAGEQEGGSGDKEGRGRQGRKRGRKEKSGSGGAGQEEGESGGSGEKEGGSGGAGEKEGGSGGAGEKEGGSGGSGEKEGGSGGAGGEEGGSGGAAETQGECAYFFCGHSVSHSLTFFILWTLFLLYVDAGSQDTSSIQSSPIGSQRQRVKQKVSRRKYYGENETQQNPDDDREIHGE